MDKKVAIELLGRAGIPTVNGKIAIADIDRAKVVLSSDTVNKLKEIQSDFENLYKSFQKPELEFASIIDKLRNMIEDHPDKTSSDYTKLKSLYESLKGNMYFSVMSPLRKYDFRFDFKDMVKRIFSTDL